VEYHTIITHVFPDLDSVVCCWLLKRFGNSKYPGISNAKVKFVSAGLLPNGESPDKLEAQGILTVDTGGGRLDTHGNKKDIDKSAALLVAQDLGIDKEDNLKQILEFTVAQDTKGTSFISKDPIFHMLGIVYLFHGLNMVYDPDYSKVMEACIKVMDLIYQAGTFSQDNWERCFPRPFPFMWEGMQLNAINAVDALMAAWLLNSDIIKNREVVLNGLQDLSLRTDIASLFFYICDRAGLLHEYEMEKFVKLTSPDYLPRQFAAQRETFNQYTLTLLNIMVGSYLQDRNLGRLVSTLTPLVDGIYFRECDWVQGLRDYDKRQLFRYKIPKKKFTAKVVAVSSASRNIARIARFKDHADMVLWHNPKEGQVSVTLGGRKSPLYDFSLKNLAAKIRVAEAYKSKDKSIDYKVLDKIGLHCGWYLHDSERILSKGSPKSPEVSSTRMKFKDLINLVRTSFEIEMPLTQAVGCPQKYCLGPGCVFYPLRLPNCASIKTRKEFPKKVGAFGHLLQQAIDEKSNKSSN
jgi:hypothetical protein